MPVNTVDGLMFGSKSTEINTMGMRRYGLITLLGCWLAWPLAAQAGQEDDIKQALRSTGVSVYVSQVSELIGNGLATRRGELESNGEALAKYDQVVTLMNRAYAVEAIERRMVKRLGKDYDRNRVRMVNQSMNSTLALRMREFSDKVRTRAGGHGGLAGKGDKPGAKREVLYKTLDEASAESELRAGAQALAVLALLDAMSASRIESLPMRSTDFDERLGIFYSQMLEPSRAEVKALYHAAYREVGDDAVTQYARLYSNRATQWFISQSIDALIAAVREIDAEVKATLTKSP